MGDYHNRSSRFWWSIKCCWQIVLFLQKLFFSRISTSCFLTDFCYEVLNFLAEISIMAWSHFFTLFFESIAIESCLSTTLPWWLSSLWKLTVTSWRLIFSCFTSFNYTDNFGKWNTSIRFTFDIYLLRYNRV